MNRIHCKMGHNKERNKTDLQHSSSQTEGTVLTKFWFGFILISLWEFITQTVKIQFWEFSSPSVGLHLLRILPSVSTSSAFSLSVAVSVGHGKFIYNARQRLLATWDFLWGFHTHICRAHQASRAIPWLYCTHSSQSCSALAHLKYKKRLPVPNPALRWRGYWCCVCISLPLNHEGYRDICNDSRISTLLYLCYCCFSVLSALPTSQHHIFLTCLHW